MSAIAPKPRADSSSPPNHHGVHPGSPSGVNPHRSIREEIYRGDADRRVFHALLAEVCERFNWWGHAYCLMGNHYHLLIETPDGNLSKGMRQLNGVYTQRFNALHGRCGHVFQGRYKAIIVQKDAYLKELSRYVRPGRKP